MIKEILYKLFNIEERPCESCETLRMQLAIVNREKEQMLQTILSFGKPAIVEPVNVNYDEIKTRPMTWTMRRQMLEAEDRAAARIIADRGNVKGDKIAEDIAKLEQELGIDEVKEDA